MRRTTLGIGAAVGLIVAALQVSGVLSTLSDTLYDVAAASIGLARPDPRVAVIAIDQDSLDRIGQFPWPRDVQARFLDRLSGVGVAGVAYDVTFTEPTPNDDAFAAAIRRLGNVTLPVLRNERGSAPLVSYDRPTAKLDAATASLAQLTLPLENDGVVRRFPVEDAEGAEGYFALGLAAALPLLGISQVDLQPPLGGQYRLGSLQVPVDATLQTPIVYAGPPGTFPRYSFFSVLQGEVPSTALQGRILVVGATAAALGDTHATPFSRLGAQTMSGVEVHANIVNMVLRQQFRRVFEVPWWALAPLLAVLTAAWTTGVARLAASRRLSAVAATSVAVLAGWVLSTALGSYLDPVPAWLSVALGYLALAYWESRQANRLTRLQLARLSAAPAVGSSGSLGPRVLDGAMRLLGARGVLAYGPDRRLSASRLGAASDRGEPPPPPSRLPGAALQRGAWSAADGLGTWMGQQQIQLAPVLPLPRVGGDPRTGGWLVPFLPAAAPAVFASGGAARLAPWTERLLDPFLAQVSAALRAGAPSAHASEDLVGQVASVISLERRLADQYGVLLATSRQVADGVVAADLSGTIYFLNDAMEPLAPRGRWARGDLPSLLEALGVLPDGSAGRALRELLTDEQPQDIQRETAAAERDWRVTLRRIDDPLTGAPIGTVAVFTDITDFKAVDRMREETMAFLAHELRTPLTAIAAASALVADEVLDSGAASSTALEATEILESGVGHMQRLIEDLLQVTRLEAGRFTLDLQRLPASRSVEEAIGLVREAAATRGISLVHQPGQQLWVRADRTRLRQVLANLLSNGVKYSPDGSQVWAVVKPAPGHPSLVQFEVIDLGAGIPEAEKATLFSKFYRGSNVAGRTTGTGLGLVIVKRLVEAQGGTVEVESLEGKGSIFRFTIPAESAPTGSPGAPVQRTAAVGAAR